MKRLFKHIIFSFYLTTLISLLIPKCALAQVDSSAVQFHGRNELVGQYSNRQGMNSYVPKDFLRNDFQMTLTIHDIPLATSFFITTEQRDDMQRINNLRFYVDLITLKKNRARIEARNRANNLKNTKAPLMLRFLSNFSKIEAGRFRPDYGELTLSGIAVSGVNIEFNHKIVYAAFASGNVKRHTEEENNVAIAYKQKMIFGKFGFGEKRTTHFYLSYMQIEDETSEPLYGAEDTVTSLKPQSNKIIGAEFRLSFLNNKWTIDGDAGVSILTRDSRIILSYDTVFNEIPQWLINAVDPNISTSGDYAYGFDTKLNLKTTTISGGFRRIGPGYITLGNPILINDRQTFEGRIDQAFLMRKLSVSAYYKQFKDNLIDWKRGTTISTALGIIARLTLKKAPYFQISFTPNYQETNGTNLSIRNRMNIFSLSTGYKYPISWLMSFTSLSYLNQMADYESDTFNLYNNSQTFSLNQIFNFKTPLQINFNANYTTMKNTDSDREVISVVLSGTHTYKKKWRNTIGGKYMNSNGASHENKFSLFWDTQINIWKNGDFGLSINENIFKNKSNVDENFNEFIVQCKLMIKW